MKLSSKLFLLALVFVLSQANPNIKILGDWDFDYHIKNSDKRWLIYFYMDYCGHCRNLQANVMDSLEWDLNKAKIGKIPCGEYRSTCLHRFGVEYIPRLFIIDNNTLYDFPFSSISKENVLESLTMTLDPKNGRPLPPAETLITTLQRDFWDRLEKTHYKLQNFVESRFEGKIKWDDQRYTLGLFAALSLSGLILLWVLLRILIWLCCSRKRVHNKEGSEPITTEKKEN